MSNMKCFESLFVCLRLLWHHLTLANPTEFCPSPPALAARAGRDRFSWDLLEVVGLKGGLE